MTIFQKQATAEQAWSLIQAAAGTVPETTGDNPQLDIPLGALRILQPSRLTGYLWTGDTRFFSRGGKQTLLAAFAYLHDTASYVKSHLGYTVLTVSKDYHAGTHVIVENDPAMPLEEAYIETTFNLWGAVAFSLSASTPLDALSHAVRAAYAGPDLPAEWNIAGLHLDAAIRALLQRTHAQLQAELVADTIYRTEFDERLPDIAQEHDIFRYLKPLQLWSIGQFCESAGLDIPERKHWKYVPQQNRRLGKNLANSSAAILAALDQDPLEKQRNALLSQLADMHQLPEGWVSARQAGRPADIVPANSLPDQLAFL